MKVRVAEVDDSEAIAGLLRQLGYERESNSVASDLIAGSAGEVIVALLDDRPIGFLTLSIRRQLHRGTAVASIDSLVVDEKARSSGIGAALVDAAVQRATDAECVLVELHSNRERTQARQFYERMGFHVTGNYFVRPLT